MNSKAYGTRNQPFVFHSHESALSFQSHCIEPMWIVLAEVGTWLVVTPADAARLERQGYEIL